jgi:hypothetical protein
MTRASQCDHRDLLQTHGWYLRDEDQELDVISWVTPTAAVLGIHPTFSLGAPSADSLNETIEDVFAGVSLSVELLNAQRPQRCGLPSNARTRWLPAQRRLVQSRSDRNHDRNGHHLRPTPTDGRTGRATALRGHVAAAVELKSGGRRFETAPDHAPDVGFHVARPPTNSLVQVQHPGLAES